MTATDVVARAKAALETQRAQSDVFYPSALLSELVAELEAARTELTFARDGMEIRPMTAVESNLMTQVLDLRRQLATAGVPIERETT